MEDGIISFTFHIAGSWDNMVKQLVWSQTANTSIRARRTHTPRPWGPNVVLSAFLHDTRISDIQWTCHFWGPIQNHWFKILWKLSKANFWQIHLKWVFSTLICTCLFPNQPHPETQSWQMVGTTCQGSTLIPSLLSRQSFQMHFFSNGSVIKDIVYSASKQPRDRLETH